MTTPIYAGIRRADKSVKETYVFERWEITLNYTPPTIHDSNGVGFGSVGYEVRGEGLLVWYGRVYWNDKVTRWPKRALSSRDVVVLHNHLIDRGKLILNLNRKDENVCYK